MIFIDIHVFYHTYRILNFINQLITRGTVQIFQSLLPNQGPLSKGFCQWSNLQPTIWGHVSRRCLFRVAFVSFLHVLSISDVSAVELTEALRHSGKVFRLQKAAPTAVSESVWSCTSQVKWRNRLNWWGWWPPNWRFPHLPWEPSAADEPDSIHRQFRVHAPEQRSTGGIPKKDTLKAPCAQGVHAILGRCHDKSGNLGRLGDGSIPGYHMIPYEWGDEHVALPCFTSYFDGYLVRSTRVPRSCLLSSARFQWRQGYSQALRDRINNVRVSLKLWIMQINSRSTFSHGGRNPYAIS